MTNILPIRPISELVSSIDRREIPEPGKVYRQIGVKWWGEGVYERPPVDGGSTLYATLNRIEVHDIVFNKIWARHGSVSIVQDELAGCYCSPEFPLYEAIDGTLDPQWFYWLTKTRNFWTQCDEKSRGTSGKNRIRPEAFLSIEIPCPSIDEQRRIIATIETIATRLNDARQLRKEINADAQALLHSVCHRLVQGAQYRPVAEVAPIVRRPVGIDLDTAYSELGVRSFGKGTFHKPLLEGADVGSKKLYRIEPGDLVLSNVFAWEGAIAVAKPEDQGRVGSHRFITCVAEPDLATADFLCFYLLTEQGLSQVRDASPGGAGRNRTLGLTKLEQIRVPLPAIEKQKEFSALQAKVAAIHQAQAANQSELDALLPAVLDKAFKGEL